MGVIHFCRRANPSRPLTISGTYSMDTGATISASVPEHSRRTMSCTSHGVIFKGQASALLVPDTQLTQVSNLRERQKSPRYWPLNRRAALLLLTPAKHNLPFSTWIPCTLYLDRTIGWIDSGLTRRDPGGSFRSIMRLSILVWFLNPEKR
jgi:hypothetical protein